MQFTHVPWNYSVVSEASRCGTQETEENSETKWLLSHAQASLIIRRTLEFLWEGIISICFKKIKKA